MVIQLETEHAELSCEPEAEGSIFREPNNFWTNLAFVFAALWIFLWTDWLRLQAQVRNRRLRLGSCSLQLQKLMLTVTGYLLMKMGKFPTNPFKIVTQSWSLFGHETILLTEAGNVLHCQHLQKHTL